MTLTRLDENGLSIKDFATRDEYYASRGYLAQIGRDGWSDERAWAWVLVTFPTVTEQARDKWTANPQFVAALKQAFSDRELIARGEDKWESLGAYAPEPACWSANARVPGIHRRSVRVTFRVPTRTGVSALRSIRVTV